MILLEMGQMGSFAGGKSQGPLGATTRPGKLSHKTMERSTIVEQVNPRFLNHHVQVRKL